MTNRLRELEAEVHVQQPGHDAVVRVPNQLLAQKAVSELAGYKMALADMTPDEAKLTDEEMLDIDCGENPEPWDVMRAGVDAATTKACAFNDAQYAPVLAAVKTWLADRSLGMEWALRDALAALEE